MDVAWPPALFSTVLHANQSALEQFCTYDEFNVFGDPSLQSGSSSSSSSSGNGGGTTTPPPQLFLLESTLRASVISGIASCLEGRRRVGWQLLLEDILSGGYSSSLLAALDYELRQHVSRLAHYSDSDEARAAFSARAKQCCEVLFNLLVAHQGSADACEGLAVHEAASDFALTRTLCDVLLACTGLLSRHAAPLRRVLVCLRALLAITLLGREAAESSSEEPPSPADAVRATAAADDHERAAPEWTPSTARALYVALLCGGRNESRIADCNRWPRLVADLSRILQAAAPPSSSSLVGSASRRSIDITLEVLAEGDGQTDVNVTVARHRDILSRTASSTLLLLAKTLRRGHRLHFEYFCSLLEGSRICLVGCKYLAVGDMLAWCSEGASRARRSSSSSSSSSDDGASHGGRDRHGSVSSSDSRGSVSSDGSSRRPVKMMGPVQNQASDDAASRSAAFDGDDVTSLAPSSSNPAPGDVTSQPPSTSCLPPVSLTRTLSSRVRAPGPLRIRNSHAGGNSRSSGNNSRSGGNGPSSFMGSPPAFGSAALAHGSSSRADVSSLSTGFSPYPDGPEWSDRGVSSPAMTTRPPLDLLGIQVAPSPAAASPSRRRRMIAEMDLAATAAATQPLSSQQQPWESLSYAGRPLPARALSWVRALGVPFEDVTVFCTAPPPPQPRRRSSSGDKAAAPVAAVPRYPFYRSCGHTAAECVLQVVNPDTGRPLNYLRLATQVNMLRLMVCVTKGKPERVASQLIANKAQIVLVRALSCGIPIVMYHALRLLRSCTRQLGLWKRRHMHVISMITRYLRAPSPRSGGAAWLETPGFADAVLAGEAAGEGELMLQQQQEQQQLLKSSAPLPSAVTVDSTAATLLLPSTSPPPPESVSRTSLLSGTGTSFVPHDDAELLGFPRPDHTMSQQQTQTPQQQQTQTQQQQPVRIITQQKQHENISPESSSTSGDGDRSSQWESSRNSRSKSPTASWTSTLASSSESGSDSSALNRNTSARNGSNGSAALWQEPLNVDASSSAASRSDVEGGSQFNFNSSGKGRGDGVLIAMAMLQAQVTAAKEVAASTIVQQILVQVEHHNRMLRTHGPSWLFQYRDLDFLQEPGIRSRDGRPAYAWAELIADEATLLQDALTVRGDDSPGESYRRVGRRVSSSIVENICAVPIPM